MALHTGQEHLSLTSYTAFYSGVWKHCAGCSHASTRDLAASGAASLRAAVDVREELPGFDPFPRRDFSAAVYAASRPLLERTLRRRVSLTVS